MRTRDLVLFSLVSLAALPLLHAEEEEMAMMGSEKKLDAKQIEFFEKKIHPIFKETCYKCHSLEANKVKGGLTLDTREGLLKGGDTGPVVKPGDPAGSLMITAVGYKDPDLQMPPKGEKLTDQQVADLTAWVKMGAPDPRKAAAKDLKTKLSGLTDKARGHWAYQPVKKPAPPAGATLKNKSWLENPALPRGVINPIDSFVLQKIEEKGMVPSPPADKETLLRRATYDLIGLPPTPKEVEAFVADHAPNAFAKVIDRLLASPHYGERWGRYWLDTARYADTVGGDRGDNNYMDYRFPYAWTYRDWVIKATNTDMPYDQFILHQLAADKIPNNPPENLAALGFLTVGERFGNNNDVINDRIDVVSKGFLAMTVSCARCHDHMFDPIPTKDYYALHGVFASINEPAEKPLIATPAPEKKALAEDFEKKLAEYEAENRAAYYQVVSDYNGMFRSKAPEYLKAYTLSRGRSAEDLLAFQEYMQTEKLDREVVNLVRGRLGDSVFAPFKRFLDDSSNWPAIAQEVAANKGNKYNPLVAAEFAVGAPSNLDDLTKVYGKIFTTVDSRGRDYINAVATAKSEPVTGFDPPTVQLLSTPLKVEPASRLTTDALRGISAAFPQQVRNKAKFVFGKINNHLLTHDGAPKRAMVVADKPKAQDTAVMIRGQANVRGDVVPRSFLEVLSPGGRRLPFKQGSGRLELAQSIATKSNPLTSRVMVNRVWMHHFGEGFVRTPDDLGTQAELPTHPELLDYLSSYFMEQGWSLKKLHKLIMLSKVYQESSHTHPQHQVIDPENRLLWRANVRRLDFESMRDTLLALGGKLDYGIERQAAGGKIIEKLVGGQPVNLTDEPYSYRRSVYGYIDRGNVPELMAHFDFSRPDMPNSKRTTTVVPQQALYLMNSPMAADAARAVVARPEIRSAADNLKRVIEIYRVIFQRDPRGAKDGKPGEVELALRFLGEELKQEPQMAQANKALSDRFGKAAKERYERSMNRGYEGQRAIQNEGSIVERKPLNAWETYAQALLLSNEAAYVN